MNNMLTSDCPMIPRWFLEECWINTRTVWA